MYVLAPLIIPITRPIQQALFLNSKHLHMEDLICVRFFSSSLKVLLVPSCPGWRHVLPLGVSEAAEGADGFRRPRKPSTC